MKTDESRKQRSVRYWIRQLYNQLLALRERSEFLLLLAVAILAAGATGFAGVADAVVEGEARMVDRHILLAFRSASDLSDPLGGPAVEEAVRDLTALGSVLLTSLFTLLVVGFQFLDGRRRRAIFVLGSVLTGVGVIFALKLGFDRPRPDLVPHAMEALSPSFPSGHAATSAVVYLTLGALDAEALPRKRLKVFAMAIALLITIGVGFSRVYLGVHWPTDVLAGWTIGATWALASWLLARDFSRRGWIESGSRIIQRDP
ncbi:hypothetical protein CRI94_13375 [Longibacter salinarum]|uniref:Phosphatidic acid phosphatase type 2/haloperoxidase domain-containing protein n=1 Tax=Longibacter salinarum TaxID=1850348 RepID=A0A2A8CVF0_9BACT|nr:phosphatase PAP2 family protein [Longibacter salinarum]PEN12685.1 hypothetical protein CRI94_13375 [Longibacter salinarum]